MHHNVENITRKIKMNANLIPSEIIILLRDVVDRVEKMETIIHGLEKLTKGGQGDCDVPKGKVSKSKVRSKDDK